MSEQGGGTGRVNRRWFIGGILAAGGAGGLAAALGIQRHEHSSKTPKRGITVVRGGMLIGGTDADPLPNAAVAIEGRKITQVGRSADVPTPPGARVIDVSGRWIIPGLVDFHMHLRGGNTDARILLAYGVTTVRDTGNTFGTLDRLRQDSASGRLPMPSIFGCERILTGDPPIAASISEILTNTDDAKTAVDRIADRGFSWVKTGVNLTPELTKAIIAEAHRRGLPVTMHASLSDC